MFVTVVCNGCKPLSLQQYTRSVEKLLKNKIFKKFCWPELFTPASRALGISAQKINGDSDFLNFFSSAMEE